MRTFITDISHLSRFASSNGTTRIIFVNITGRIPLPLQREADTILNHEHDILTQVSLWYVNRNCQHLRGTEVRLMQENRKMKSLLDTGATISNVFVSNPTRFILAGGCLNV